MKWPLSRLQQATWVSLLLHGAGLTCLMETGKGFQSPVNGQPLLVFIGTVASDPSTPHDSISAGPVQAPPDASISLHETEHPMAPMSIEESGLAQKGNVPQVPPAPSAEVETVGSPAAATEPPAPEPLRTTPPALPAPTWGFGLRPRQATAQDQNRSALAAARQIELRRGMMQAQLLTAIGQIQTTWTEKDGPYTCLLVLRHGFTQGEIHCEPEHASARVLTLLSRLIAFSRDKRHPTAEPCLQFSMPEGTVTEMACQPPP